MPLDRIKRLKRKRFRAMLIKVVPLTVIVSAVISGVLSSMLVSYQENTPAPVQVLGAAKLEGNKHSPKSLKFKSKNTFLSFDYDPAIVGTPESTFTGAGCTNNTKQEVINFSKAKDLQIILNTCADMVSGNRLEKVEVLADSSGRKLTSKGGLIKYELDKKPPTQFVLTLANTGSQHNLQLEASVISMIKSINFRGAVE